MHFQAERLKIRNLRLSDFPAFHEMQSNPNVMRYTAKRADTEQESQEGLDRCIAHYAKPDNEYRIWAVERKLDGAFIGTCAIVEGNEIGYRFLEKYWGQGYASEIINPLIDHGLEVLCLPFLFAEVDVRNIASVKVLERSKLMFIKEFFNEESKTQDRMYRLERG